jgi:hypothetical protein
MIAFSGQSVTIKNIGKVISDWSSCDNRYLYYIEEDGGKHLWDEDMLLSSDILCDAREEECIGASRTSPPTKESGDSDLQTFEARSMKRNMGAIERAVAKEIESRKKHIKTADPVAHPAHYTYGKIEVIDFIQDKDLNFALGNAVKYIVRAGHKAEQGMSDEEKAIQDLEKAKQYIDFEIERRKGVR